MHWMEPALGKHKNSAAAADSVQDSVKAQRQEIEDFVRGRRRFGATREEASIALHIPIQSVTPRVRALLANSKLVELKDETRPTRTGRDAAILVAPEFANHVPLQQGTLF